MQSQETLRAGITGPATWSLFFFLLNPNKCPSMIHLLCQFTRTLTWPLDWMPLKARGLNSQFGILCDLFQNLMLTNQTTHDCFSIAFPPWGERLDQPEDLLCLLGAQQLWPGVCPVKAGGQKLSGDTTQALSWVKAAMNRMRKKPKGYFLSHAVLTSGKASPGPHSFSSRDPFVYPDHS